MTPHTKTRNPSRDFSKRQIANYVPMAAPQLSVAEAVRNCLLHKLAVELDVTRKTLKRS